MADTPEMAAKRWAEEKPRALDPARWAGLVEADVPHDNFQGVLARISEQMGNLFTMGDPGDDLMNVLDVARHRDGGVVDSLRTSLVHGTLHQDVEAVQSLVTRANEVLHDGDAARRDLAARLEAALEILTAEGLSDAERSLLVTMLILLRPDLSRTPLQEGPAYAAIRSLKPRWPQVRDRLPRAMAFVGGELQDAMARVR